MRGGVDADAVAPVAGDGLAVGRDADEVTLNGDVGGVEGDTGVTGADDGERTERGAVGTGGESEAAGAVEVDRDDGGSGETGSGGAVDVHGVGDGGQGASADTDGSGDGEVDGVCARGGIREGDGLAKRAGSGGVQVRDLEGAQELTVLQPFEAVTDLRRRGNPPPGAGRSVRTRKSETPGLHGSTFLSNGAER